jgi:transcription-repair coupling factor (superfamily II helicase)
LSIVTDDNAVYKLRMTTLSTILSGVPASAHALVLARLIEGGVPPLPAPHSILHIATNDRALEALQQALEFFVPDAEILTFPAWDTMPYDRASPRPAIMAARMKTLSLLASANASKKPRIILATASAILQKLPPREAMGNIVFSIRRGEKLNQDALMSYLTGQGYRRLGKAMESGEFALRGGIIDIVPSGMSEGVRIDLFGDTVESLKTFDPMTQISSPTLPLPLEGGGLGGGELTLFPMSEVLLNNENITRFREKYRELFGAVSKEDPLYEAISQGAAYPGMEHWLPLFYEHADSLLDYCKDSLITFDSEAQTAIKERQESILDYYEARKTAASASSKKNSFTNSSFAGGAIYNPVAPDSFFIMGEVWEKILATRDNIGFSPFNPSPSPFGKGRGEGKPSLENPHPHPLPKGEGELKVSLPKGEGIYMAIRPVLRFIQGQAENSPFAQLKEQAEKGKPILLACFSQGSVERLQTLLMEHSFHCLRIGKWQERKNIKGKTIGLTVLPLEHGFETEKLLVFSEQDVLGERITRAVKKKKTSEAFLQEASNFAEGDLVVHKDHGIGRFEGLITLEVSGASHDCLKLIYAGDDKLFLPVENIEMLSRFGLEEENTQLDKLGGASWQNRKARLKQRIKIAAEALLKIAAERLVKRGYVIDTQAVTYDDFCARFPYAETDDQARAIEEVLEDLRSGKPMDRLVCGDVGFGKTEVALRAAFATACNEEQPLQVALVCPTTLLARQHFRNFRERFSGFPVTVRQLSRMVTAKEQKDTKEGLESGKVDIVIGTHALLAKQIKFKKLGLVIVDEEQHFGVGQKEKLKELKSDVHVLTLSATPIPRTLQMALTGVRDLSLITTPPVDRLAVRSFVMPFDPVVIREAILRELHRGGKCFVVTPRIKYMADLKWQIAELVPEARIATAHGQLPATELDSIMNDFYDGKYDILLSTAIIESGLDIPTANTMIIHNAHLFGLAQLYQMRGRVGRGKTRAYAYFLLPHHRELTKNATKRLEVMQTLDTLGAGFTLASHDMDIRGFGNLVGEEQSGHIREVGIELYQHMLEEAVAALRADSGQRSATSKEHPDHQPPATDDYSPSINLGISVLIPESYVNDLQLRLGLYRRVAQMDSEDEINSFAAELVDRFGDMPEEARHLITTLNLKLLCRKAGIERIDTGAKGAVISFHNNYVANPEALLKHIERHPRRLKLRPDQKLVFTHEWKDNAEKIASIKKLLMELIGLR